MHIQTHVHTDVTHSWAAAGGQPPPWSSVVSEPTAPPYVQTAEHATPVPVSWSQQPVNKVTLVSKLSLFIFRTWSISAEKKSQNCFIQAAAVTKTKRQQGLELWDQTTFVIMYNLLNYSYYYFIITHDITTYYDHTSKIDLTIIPSNLATKTWNQLTCSEM